MDNRDRLLPLRKEEIELVHHKSLEVMDKTGMWFQSSRAREIFQKHGVRVEGEFVYFTEDQIQDALKTVPPKFTLLARNSARNMPVGEGYFAFGPSGGSPFILDYDGTMRVSTSEDYENSLKLTQMLDCVDFNRELVASGGDIAADNILLYELFASIKMTDKPLDCTLAEGVGLLAILFGISKEKMKDTGQGIAYAIGTANPLSPLGMSAHESDTLIDICRYNVAVAISPMPMAGMTAPSTLPGLLITQNCEILGALVLSQLVNPGCPVLYGCIGTITNMRNACAPIGAPEARLIEYASAQLASWYGVPARGDVGLSDANCLDFQAGAESAFHFVNAVRNGLHLLPGLGAMGSWNIGSLEKMVLDAELAAYTKRLLRPLEFSEENMAVSLIKKVGPRGSFIAEEHTFHHFRREFYDSVLFSRIPYENWEQQGKKDVLDNAHKKVREMLNDYQPPDLEGSLEKDLEKYTDTHYV
ncbi:trimethylamine methyltransferase family protein [Candidatus Formimonas warabiya]|uniref:Trimethylamine methyltransferase n=1 Tax=Formimonas warabiya TaxID=1761012 RepID=A0A3G1KVL8_FORW1|nr:trimethylamine methyltransferase family protein [Candidatus Formimonas warabiya]ATW26504.1 hypothetical protein DCMF_18670 [Candidatus Formimonas warabiya]